MAQIFISHSSADTKWVELIAAHATALGVTPYLAEHDPRPGTNLSQKVREAIRASDAMIVLLTTNSMESPYVQQEIGVAVEQGKLVVPLVHPDVEGRSRALLDGVEYIVLDFASPAPATTALIGQLQMIAEHAADQQAAERRREMIGNAIVVGVLVGLIILALQAESG
jgi:hypothetical protein